MKMYLLSICLVYSLTNFSQGLKKGDKLFGGSFSFNTHNSNTSVFNSSGGSNTGLAPSFSWLIKDNLAMGIRGGIGYSSYWLENQSGQKDKSNTINSGFSLFLKNYHAFSEKFGYYFDKELGINFMSNRQESGNSATVIKSNNKGVVLKFSPGLYYRFSNNFMGEANIGGAYAAYNKNNSGTKNFNAGLSFLEYFNLGINYRINTKDKGKP